MELSKDQQKAKDLIIDRIRSKSKLITLGGYAGTGKTTLINNLAHTLREEHFAIAFCAYTGKAASVLRNKVEKGTCDTFSTIHYLIYDPIIKHGKLIGWRLKSKEDIEASIIIVDEASMVSEPILKDLQSLNIPIIAVGDHGQLPPVKGVFSLMSDPDVKLEKIHRQAEGNPIIKLSLMARLDGHIPVKEYSDNVKKFTSIKQLPDLGNIKEWMIMSAMNKTRVNLNKYVRKELGYKRELEENEKVICLRNNRYKGIYNGMIGFVKGIPNDTSTNGIFEVSVKFEGIEKDAIELNVPSKQLHCNKTLLDIPRRLGSDNKKSIDLIDYGYCITVHKAQGSESSKALLFEEQIYGVKMDYRKWLYTGVTRAKETLFIIGK